MDVPVVVEADNGGYPPKLETPVTELRLDQQGDVERNVCESPLTELRLDSSSKQPPAVSAEDINKRLEAGSSSSEKRAVRKLDEEYGIGCNTLHQHSGEKLEDAAFILGVSRSTLKRICRTHGIKRWPPRKTKKFKSSHDESIQATEGNVGDRRMEDESVSNLLCLNKGSPCKEGKKVMVKVSYQFETIKFEVPVSITWLELEEKVATRMKLSVGSFKVKYLDEDKELISMTCEEDLRICMKTLTTSTGKSATIRMIVCRG